MSDTDNRPAPPTDSTYIAHLWEYPGLTLAVFGLQVHSPEAWAMYDAAGIPQQMDAALRDAEGLLLMRTFQEGMGGIMFQYWRTHEDLAAFARQMPHTDWWKWLTEHRGKGLAFYHEIYQCKTAEAVFEVGTQPVGPAVFCTTSAVSGGEGRSAERQRRFVEATERKT